MQPCCRPFRPRIDEATRQCLICFSILQSNYKAVGTTSHTRLPYVHGGFKLYQGTWEGAYSDNTKFTIQVSNVTGFRAKVRYQSGSTISYQDVLINANSFKFGTSKFTLIKAGQAQIKYGKRDQGHDRKRRKATPGHSAGKHAKLPSRPPPSRRCSCWRGRVFDPS